MIMAIRGFLSAPTNSSKSAGGLNVFPLGAFSSEFFGDLSGKSPIEYRDRKTLGFHIQDEIFAHHGRGQSGQYHIDSCSFLYLLL